MYLYRRGRIWWVQYMVDGVLHRCSTHKENKKVAQQWVGNITLARKAPTFEEAVEILRIVYRKKNDEAVMLDSAWECYEQLAKAIGKLNIKDKTLQDRKNELNRFIDWLKHNSAKVSTIEEVTGTMAVAYAEDLARNQARKTHTRQNIIGHLSSIWNMLEKASSRIANPWKNITPRNTDGKRIPHFTIEQEKTVLQAAKEIGKDWFPICIIARHTGLRYGDIARLKWEAVDTTAGVIHLIPSKTVNYEIAVELPLIKPLREVIATLKQDGEYLFPLHAKLYGKPYKKGEKRLCFRDVLIKAGIEGAYTFHSWRHTAATRLAEAGVSMETRKKILGHTRDATAARYDHDGHLKAIREAMEAASVN